MIWKLYKIVTTLFFRNLVSVLLHGTESQESLLLQTKMVRLRHIIETIRAYSNLHPVFARTTFGTLNDYLEQRLSAQELTLLTEHVSLLSNGVNARVNHSLS